MIDNGNHLLLGANESTRAYLADIDAGEMIREIAPAAFPFMDLSSGERWRVRPGGGLLPTWIFSKDRRIPGTTTGEYLRQAYRLKRAGKTDTVLGAVGNDSVLYENAVAAPMSGCPEHGCQRSVSKTDVGRFARDFHEGRRSLPTLVFPQGPLGCARKSCHQVPERKQC